MTWLTLQYVILFLCIFIFNRDKYLKVITVAYSINLFLFSIIPYGSFSVFQAAIPFELLNILFASFLDDKYKRISLITLSLVSLSLNSIQVISIIDTFVYDFYEIINKVLLEMTLISFCIGHPQIQKLKDKLEGI